MPAVSCGKPQIDICVATYKRPPLLATLLESLATQETQGQFTCRIVVVDNDPRRSAESVVRGFQARTAEIIYDVEPEQSISLTRNRGFAHAAGAYIATIDDDQYADREWLLQLFNALARYEADVVFGPVVHLFDSRTPAYIRGCELFNLPNPPTGSAENFICYTGNALMRRAVIAGVPGPFDPGLGLSGGEDTALFDRLRRQGRRLVWCREGRVYTVVPRQRATLRWIAQRAFSSGNNWHRALQRDPDWAGVSRRAEIFHALMHMARLFCLSFLCLIAAPFDARCLAQAARHLERMAFLLGLCASHLHVRYEEYRDG